MKIFVFIKITIKAEISRVLLNWIFSHVPPSILFSLRVSLIELLPPISSVVLRRTPTNSNQLRLMSTSREDSIIYNESCLDDISIEDHRSWTNFNLMIFLGRTFWAKQSELSGIRSLPTLPGKGNGPGLMSRCAGHQIPKMLTNFRLCCVDVWDGRKEGREVGRVRERRCCHHLPSGLGQKVALACAWAGLIRGPCQSSLTRPDHRPPLLTHDIFTNGGPGDMQNHLTRSRELWLDPPITI